jgi:hypothetical protein
VRCAWCCREGHENNTINIATDKALFSCRPKRPDNASAVPLYVVGDGGSRPGGLRAVVVSGGFSLVPAVSERSAPTRLFTDPSARDTSSPADSRSHLRYSSLPHLLPSALLVVARRRTVASVLIRNCIRFAFFPPSCSIRSLCRKEQFLSITDVGDEISLILDSDFAETGFPEGVLEVCIPTESIEVGISHERSRPIACPAIRWKIPAFAALLVGAGCPIKA